MVIFLITHKFYILTFLLMINHLLIIIIIFFDLLIKKLFREPNLVIKYGGNYPIAVPNPHKKA